MTGVPDNAAGNFDYGWTGARVLEHGAGIDSIEMGARPYVPSLGRFVQEDRVTGGSANGYAYAFGDPQDESDTSGLYSVSDISADGWRNAETAFLFFRDQGLTDKQCASIVGNFLWESGMIPSKRQVNGPAVGIAQWERSRKSRLFSDAADDGMSWDDLTVQLNFVMNEFTSTYQYAYSLLKGSPSIPGGTTNVCKWYEQPHGATPSFCPNFSGRYALASAVYHRFHSITGGEFNL